MQVSVLFFSFEPSVSQADREFAEEDKGLHPCPAFQSPPTAQCAHPHKQSFPSALAWVGEICFGLFQGRLKCIFSLSALSLLEKCRSF